MVILLLNGRQHDLPLCIDPYRPISSLDIRVLYYCRHLI